MSILIGLTGENCAGKGTVADYLVKKGFVYLSLSDVIRDELKREGKEETRENLIAKGNALRGEGGPGAIARKIAAKLESHRNYVIDSIRNPSEVEELRKQPNFFLLYVTAAIEVRFQRMQLRNREGDSKTFEAFKALEEREKKGSASQQNLDATAKMADWKIVNNSDVQQLCENIDKALAKLSSDFKFFRPSWDEYFMSIAKVVATRSNCMKRKVASIVVKDKRIISTGYNGTPRGVKNCNEGGCARCNDFADAGTDLSECVCSHGEENAIVQAAYHGISIKGAVLYTTFSPCLFCTKLIINAGVAEVVYNADYPLTDLSLRLLQEAGVPVRQHKL